jgi:hypothetical protein
MVIKRHWVITRPKRKLILVPDLLRIFSAVAEGQRWNRNRDIQKQFEQSLTDAQWKAQNLSADGSGGRTYAALLFMLGLWYEDSNIVNITNAGREIIDGAPPVPILTKQLLDFQYPSPYSIKSNVNVAREFRIQPFRFILNLFLEKNFTVISQDEIAFCLVPFAKTAADLDSCSELIHNFRVNQQPVIRRATRSSETTEDNLKNIGNTVVNQFEYTGLFIEQEDSKSLELKPGMREKASGIISGLRTSLIQNPNDEVLFQKRYGCGLLKSKDYSQSIRQPMDINPTHRKIVERFYVISSNEPVYSLTPALINRISTQTGAQENLVQRVLTRLPIASQPSQFEDSYLQLSVGGKTTAEDFERKTTVLFNDGFGLESIWVGNRPRHPDIIIYIDKINKIHGIIDTKAYKEYNLPLNHKNIMAYTYIPDLSIIEYEGEKYKLVFYGYVAGGYISTIRSSFNELRGMTPLSGHYITARNLIALFRLHRQKPIPTARLVELFSSNQEIIPDRLNLY